VLRFTARSAAIGAQNAGSRGALGIVCLSTTGRVPGPV